ncbi:MAG: 30S ribosomal protein S16 [Planctomycetota bacterium]
MAVRIRLKRIGRKNRPFYRIDVFDHRTKRDGRSIENLGYYDPHVEDDDKKVTIRVDRVKHWLSQGAEVSLTVGQFLRAKGITEPEKGRRKKTEKEREKRKKRRKVMGKCKSKRRIKMLTAKEKAKNRPKAPEKKPESEQAKPAEE